MNIYRSRIVSPLRDPFIEGSEPAFLDLEDGYLAVTGEGVIAGVGAWADLPPEWSEAFVVDFGREAFISPPFVDAHLHGPQIEMIGSYGGHLLEWLERYTFPTEARFADPFHARRVARGLFEELLRNGTLAGLIFSTVHTEATEILFEEADQCGIRAIIGKTMMDRNAPPDLLENAKSAYEGSRELLLRWRGHERLGYSVSPRFAPTCSPEMLERAGDLLREFPEAYMHTHISENQTEVAWVRELYPDDASYTAVYDRFGLLGERSILAHGVHLSDAELELLRERRSRICHCPNSNLFLGSGLFPMKRVRAAGVPVALGSDIGAGTTPSMLNAMADAYKVQQVLSVSLTPFQLWYLGTLAGARALSLDDKIGSFETGKDADFIVVDLGGTNLLERRIAGARNTEEILAGVIFIGDDRVIARGYVRGREVWNRDGS